MRIDLILDGQILRLPFIQLEQFRRIQHSLQAFLHKTTRWHQICFIYPGQIIRCITLQKQTGTLLHPAVRLDDPYNADP